MDKSIYILVCIVLFMACKGGAETNTETQSLSSIEQEKENKVIDENAISIKDVFLLLPNDVFPVEEISKENRALLIKHIGEDKAFDISSTPIGICDVKNGYLNLTGLQYDWEMCYWNLSDGSKLVAVNNITETGSKIRVFFYNDGKLSEDFNYKLGGNQTYKLTDFIDPSQLSPKSHEYAEQQFAKGAYLLYYQLPQNGTSITVTLDIDNLIDDQENYDAFYEASKDVILHWKNEKWER